MSNTPEQPNPSWKDYQYDSFMIREKELNKQTEGTGSALQQGLEVTNFPDSSIEASSIKAGTLNGDFKFQRSASVVAVSSDTTITTGDGTSALALPEMLNKANLINVLVTVHTLGTSGNTTVQIRRRRNGSDSDMLSTLITIPYGSYYEDNGIINPLYDDVLTGDQIYIDIDSVAGGSPKGLSVVLTFF